MESHVTNKHLKSKLEEVKIYLENGNHPPEDIFFEFLAELRLSNLLLPAIRDGDLISFANLQLEGGLKVLPLFSDEEEMSGYADEYSALSNDFGYYVNLVNDCDFGGIMINCQSDEFFMDRELLNGIPPLDEVNFDDGASALRLREISLNVTNDSLVEFIRDKANINNWHGLVLEMSKSVLLNVVMAESGKSDESGVVRRLDSGGFSLPISRGTSRKYGLLFTSVDAIRESLEDFTSLYHYQISDLCQYFKFILTNDMDGIIINPDLDDYYIPRSILLKIFEEKELFDNPDLRGCMNYAFYI